MQMGLAIITRWDPVRVHLGLGAIMIHHAAGVLKGRLRDVTRLSSVTVVMVLMTIVSWSHVHNARVVRRMTITLHTAILVSRFHLFSLQLALDAFAVRCVTNERKDRADAVDELDRVMSSG